MFVGKPVEALFDQAILVHTNRLRAWVNGTVRDVRFGQGKKLVVEKHEQIICLKNGNVDGPYSPRIFNGMRAFVTDKAVVGDHRIAAHVAFPEERIASVLDLCRHQFGAEKTFKDPNDLEPYGAVPYKLENAGMLFDWGYALTVHKAQGSQFSDVLVCYERSPYAKDEEFRRWLYTAVTRASERLTIVLGKGAS
jgi:exodeoxyribonuclease-5